MSDLDVKYLTVAFNDHVGLLLNGIWERYEKEDGTDFSILCEGGDCIKVHRWLMEIFAPQLVAKASLENSIRLNTQKSTIKLMLEFLYKGGVCVDDDGLEELRKGAQAFMLENVLECLGTGIETQVVSSEDNAMEQEDSNVEISTSCTEIKENESKCDEENIQHPETVKTVKGFECDICNKVMSSAGVLSSHRRIHFRDDQRTCKECGKTFKQPVGLKKHLKDKHQLESTNEPTVDEDIAKIKCPLCDFTVPQQTFLVNHLIVMHQVDEQLNHVEPSLCCSRCDYKCYKQTQLLSHNFSVHRIRANEDAKKFLCELCDNGFSSVSHLKRHKKLMHDPNIVRHKCTVCEFSTKTKDNLNQHLAKLHKIYKFL